MSKRPLGHGDLTQMSNFKAVAADYAYFASLSEEGRLYCLSDRQVYILLVQCEYIGWITRWYNTDDITKKTVELIQADVMGALMSCVDVSILIDQANLNLVDSVTHNQIESQRLRDILESEYIPDDPTSINPSAPTTDFGSTGDRYDALCSGLTAFVYQFARAQADSARAAQVGGLAAVALVALLLIPGLNFFFVVGASIAVALGLGTIGVSLETAIAALTDTTALGNVICFMRDTLKDQDVTEANWTACLDTYPFGVGTHEAIVADFIKACLPQNYLTILNILGQAYDGTLNGDAMPECPCEPDTWSHTFPDGDGWSAFTLETFEGATTTESGGTLIGATNTAGTAVFINFGITVDADVQNVAVTIEWSGPSVLEQALNLYIDSVLVESLDLNALTSPATLSYPAAEIGSHEYELLGGVIGATADGKYLNATASVWSGNGSDPFA